MNNGRLDSLKQKEMAAWMWLLNLERMDWKETSVRQSDQQVIVRLCPGDLGEHRRAPLVHVSVSIPALPGRIKATGNSLFEATDCVRSEIWRKGIILPYIELMLE